MYNKQLDTFMMAAETGSFSKAARRLFISPSAVLQQISLLESDLSTVLFIRNNQGVQLTPAGRYLYGEAGELIRKSREIRQELASLKEKNGISIRVGTNFFHRLKAFYEIWFRFQMLHPEYKISSYPIGDIPPDSLTDVDVLEGVYFHEPWKKDYDFYPLAVSPICVGLPKDHALASRGKLEITDLQEIPVVVSRKGISEEIDGAAEELEKCGIRTISVESYDPSTFLFCTAKRYGILLCDYSRDLNVNLTTVPVNWDRVIPYGLFVRKKPGKGMEEFLKFIREWT